MIWGRCTATNINRLLKLQKRAACIIFEAGVLTPSWSMFDELKWLPLPKRIQNHTSIVMYKSPKGKAPDYLTDLFNQVSESHFRNLRSVQNDLLRVPYSRTCYYDRSFGIQGAKQWNSLPIDTRNASSLDSFKVVSPGK